MATTPIALTVSIRTVSNIMLIDMENIMLDDLAVEIEDMQYEGFNPTGSFWHTFGQLQKRKG